jgi:hypothetical protein
MTQKDAAAVAALLCRTHGEQVAQFVESQVRRFQSEARSDVAVTAWERVAEEVNKLRAARQAA